MADITQDLEDFKEVRMEMVSIIDKALEYLRASCMDDRDHTIVKKVRKEKLVRMFYDA